MALSVISYFAAEHRGVQPGDIFWYWNKEYELTKLIQTTMQSELGLSASVASFT
jgi:hypothetical protein